MDSKLTSCISAIEYKCQELTKLTDSKDRVGREYSMLAQRILNNLETLRKKQNDREEKERAKEDAMIEKIQKQHINNTQPKSIMKKRGRR